jgi:hypothetical protein
MGTRDKSLGRLQLAAEAIFLAQQLAITQTKKSEFLCPFEILEKIAIINFSHTKPFLLTRFFF